MATNLGQFNGRAGTYVAVVSGVVALITGVVALLAPIHLRIDELTHRMENHLGAQDHPFGVLRQVDVLAERVSRIEAASKTNRSYMKAEIRSMADKVEEHQLHPKLHHTGFSLVRGELRSLRERIIAVEHLVGIIRVKRVPPVPTMMDEIEE